MKLHLPLFMLILIIIVLNAQTIPAQEQQALVSPFKGSTLIGSYNTQFTGLIMLVNPLDSKKNPATMVKEGELNSNIYKSPENVSTYELYKSYLGLFTGADFDILLDCKVPDCNVKNITNGTYGYPNYVFINRTYEGEISSSEKGYLTGWTEYYLSVKKTTADGTYYIMILISSQRNLYSIDVLKVDEMDEESVNLSPELLKEKIKSEGKAVLEGIFFETGKAIIMEESNPALAQIAIYLNENPEFYYYVVGHTDDTGNFEENLSLSEKRANAVIEALKAIGVNVSRLNGHGVGPLSPSATNQTEIGKSKNRRVELVLKLE